MGKLAFVISLVALAVSLLAYQEAGGTKDLSQRLEALREDIRRETADSLARLEKALRSSDPAKANP